MKKILARLGAYFFRGLVFLTPLAIIAWVIYSLYEVTDGIVFFPGKPWLDIIVIWGGFILLVLMMGLLVSSFLFQPIFDSLEKILLKTPGIKLIYTSIKDMMEAFVGEKKRFNRPVLVTLFKETNLQRIGFITDDDLSDLGIKGKVAVYIPMSYSFSGNLYIVPAGDVEPLKGVSAADAMKFVVSGGVTRTEEEMKEHR